MNLGLPATEPQLLLWPMCSQLAGGVIQVAVAESWSPACLPCCMICCQLSWPEAQTSPKSWLLTWLVLWLGGKHERSVGCGPLPIDGAGLSALLHIWTPPQSWPTQCHENQGSGSVLKGWDQDSAAKHYQSGCSQDPRQAAS